MSALMEFTCLCDLSTLHPFSSFSSSQVLASAAPQPCAKLLPQLLMAETETEHSPPACALLLPIGLGLQFEPLFVSVSVSVSPKAPLFVVEALVGCWTVPSYSYVLAEVVALLEADERRDSGLGVAQRCHIVAAVTSSLP
jgi:hypothetical protein